MIIRLPVPVKPGRQFLAKPSPCKTCSKIRGAIARVMRPNPKR